MIRLDQSLELMLDMSKRICTQCGVNQVYIDIEAMDWCEECLWKHVQEDGEKIDHFCLKK